MFDRHNFSSKVDSVVIPWDEKISNFTPTPFVRSLHCVYEKLKPFSKVFKVFKVFKGLLKAVTNFMDHEGYFLNF